MGLFDFFKRKKEKDKLQSYIEDLQKKIFPGGAAEVAKQVSEIMSLLGNRYSEDDVANLLHYMSTLFMISQDKSAYRIVKTGAMHRPDNVFSEPDATTVYKYVVKQNFIKDFGMFDEFGFAGFYKSLGNIEDGSTTDVIPGAYGEFGLCNTNPVPVRGILANETYLKKLRLASGKDFTWQRIGSTGAPNIKHPIDMYQITTNSGEDICVIYISPYQSTISNKAPKGFFISKE